MSEEANTVVFDIAARDAALGEATWHQLPAGVRFKMRPLAGLDHVGIGVEVEERRRALAEGGDILDEFGFDSSQLPLLMDEKVAVGFVHLMRLSLIAKRVVDDWNLVDASGAPVPMETGMFFALFNAGPAPGLGPVMVSAFESIVLRPLARVNAEKKGSAASPSGDTAAAANTAPGAETSGSAAPPAAGTNSATAAPKRKPRPVPSKAS
jgi:hypothetical protein